MSRVAMKRIYDVMMVACNEGRVPDGVYGPKTVRWATPEECKEFGLTEYPIVHLDHDGKVDCYFTTEQAVIVRKQA
jgi:hypothetical protein